MNVHFTWNLKVSTQVLQGLVQSVAYVGKHNIVPSLYNVCNRYVFKKS